MIVNNLGLFVIVVELFSVSSSFVQFGFCFLSFNLFLVFCSFFDSTGCYPGRGERRIITTHGGVGGGCNRTHYWFNWFFD